MDRTATRVLLVDDNKPLRALNRFLLERTGRFEVIGEAEEGHEAIRLAGVLSPDLVLLDLVMPRLGGMEALPEIRRALPDALIVVLSMLQKEGTETEVVRRGADAFLDKGLDTNDFLERLIRIVDGDPPVERSLETPA